VRERRVATLAAALEPARRRHDAHADLAERERDPAWREARGEPTRVGDRERARGARRELEVRGRSRARARRGVGRQVRVEEPITSAADELLERAA
jgi:hypothetical protein